MPPGFNDWKYYSILVIFQTAFEIAEAGKKTKHVIKVTVTERQSHVMPVKVKV
jgi:hypothetical protein